MSRNHPVDLWSAEEIGLWGSVAGELDRLRDAVRQSVENAGQGIDSLSRDLGSINKKLAELEKVFDVLAAVNERLERLEQTVSKLRKPREVKSLKSRKSLKES